MLDQITNSLVSFNKEAAVIALGALPVSELRGAIPLAMAMGFSPLKAYILAFTGNILPVIPLLFLLQPVASRFRHIKWVGKFFDWLYERTRKKASLVEKFEVVGLILFVAIPLPITGAWTGCVAATLFKIRFRYAFPAILAGIVIAGLIVLGLSIAGKGMLSGNY
ncbi:MAG: small multi-drug export protein [Candidatus Omnitrophica bacterium]|nr:small multi-drug export protein [Candidatus Omnitrophota bacterium]MBU1128675.1 small multi-drug export protein [Candidatus Omnitrophota bacterium]MBU1657173.1 small multi-drug export protein [Candidatus Omnitrophota bacterium]MBU1785169.1 small multi-drug export protein [Candidatus Omnitrophota bacterium]MBU1852195.1 small multi-drug export protein [Candidatus Omnitrophota bacterium]